jgi:hypothetical protein
MSITTENDNIYMNIVINGNTPNYPPNMNNSVTGEQPVLAEYSENKTEPFLSKPSEYYAAVTRFVIPLNKVPLFIMPIVPNTYVSPIDPGDVDQSTLVLGIQYLGVKYSEYVEYIADNDLTPPPAQNLPTQIKTPYYYVYTYAALIEMLNLTLANLWMVSGLAAANPSINPPYFYYDPALQLISIIVPSLFAVGTASIFINESSLQFLEAFEYSFNGYNNTGGNDYYFIFQNQTQFFYPQYTGTNTSTYYKYTQEYNVLYYWASLRKILVLSNTLPILNEVVPSNNNSGVIVGLPIITDFIPQLSTAGDTRSIAIYNPSSQYRLIDLNGQSPISKIDIKLLWQDVQGNSYPIYISAGQEISLKIGFFKKTLYKNTTNLNMKK